MPAGIGIFGSKRRPKGVHAAQRQCPAFHVQLTTDGEVALLAEEVLAEVHLAIRSARQVGQVKRADAEHFTSTFAITCSDDRCVNPEEAVVAEVAMYCLRHGVANTAQCAERIGA